MNRSSTPKVIILCGGLGTRLREETEFRPKPMVEVGGEPMLWHIMKIYAHHGFKDFVLCLGYKGDHIRDYFMKYRYSSADLTVDFSRGGDVQVHRARVRAAEADWRVTLVETGDKAMTGARLKRVEPYVDTEHFLLTYGDGLSDVDVAAVYDFHRRAGRIGTVTGVHPPARFGELVLDGEESPVVREFREKPQTQRGYINGGFFAFDRRFFSYVTDDDSCTLERAPLERLAADGQLSAYLHDGYWRCMDTLRDRQALQEEWDSGHAPWKKWSAT